MTNDCCSCVSARGEWNPVCLEMIYQFCIRTVGKSSEPKELVVHDPDQDQADQGQGQLKDQGLGHDLFSLLGIFSRYHRLVKCQTKASDGHQLLFDWKLRPYLPSHESKSWLWRATDPFVKSRHIINTSRKQITLSLPSFLRRPSIQLRLSDSCATACLLITQLHAQVEKQMLGGLWLVNVFSKWIEKKRNCLKSWKWPTVLASTSGPGKTWSGFGTCLRVRVLSTFSTGERLVVTNFQLDFIVTLFDQGFASLTTDQPSQKTWF